MSRPALALVGLGLVTALAAAACSASGGAPTPGASPIIPQPARPDLPLAPDSQRVDLVRPAFSNPTTITNPLFPVSAQASVLHMGTVDGEPLRTVWGSNTRPHL